MPELRKDPIIGRWVIISTERGKRPTDFTSVPQAKSSSFCPFCAGNESKTPPEVYALREPGSPKDGPGWKVRVVSNKFPALQIEGDLNRQGEGIYDKMNGVGAHEVIIETPEHDLTLSDLDEDRIFDVLTCWQQRIIDLKKDARFKYIVVFKNHGEAAGASLEHTHTQLVAMPIIPKRVVEEIEGGRKYYEFKERCIFCDIVSQEVNEDVRVVSANQTFLAIEPFAARFPFETWILPKTHMSAYEELEPNGVRRFARILKEVLFKINTALNSPPYNFILHTLPLQGDNRGWCHWHLEIMPKLTKVAGFEWGSGFYINPTAPEEAARYLREIAVTSNRK
ncbi:MAG: galactose-1-phosphate uridylyltransferase [Candidatus Eisenbacteria bacterium]